MIPLRDLCPAKYFFIAFFLLISNHLNAQISFQKIYETTLEQSPEVVLPMQNSGYVICGNEFDPTTFTYDNIYLIRTDVLGAQQWVKEYGNIDNFVASDMCITSDNSIVTVGYYSVAGSGALEDCYILKTDSSGNILWNFCIGGNSSDLANKIIETPDGGYVIVGNTYSFGVLSEIYVFKIDQSGNKLWSRVMTNGSGMTAASVKNTMDGGLILVGQVGSPYNIQIIKMDSIGIPQWDKNYNGLVEDRGFEIEQIADSGYVVICDTRDGDDATVFRINKNGVPLWGRILTANFNSVKIQGIKIGNDNNIYIGGEAYDSLFVEKIYLFKMDTAGNGIWTTTYGGPLDDNYSSFTQLSDSTFLLLGKGNGFSSNGSYLIKTGIGGSSPCNRSELLMSTTQINITIDTGITWFTPNDTLWNPSVNVNTTTFNEIILCLENNLDNLSNNFSEPIIFPNPSNKKFNIHFSENTRSEKKISILNILGEVVLSIHTYEEDISFTLDNQKYGIYYCRIEDNNIVSYSKSFVLAGE